MDQHGTVVHWHRASKPRAVAFHSPLLLQLATAETSRGHLCCRHYYYYYYYYYYLFLWRCLYPDFLDCLLGGFCYLRSNIKDELLMVGTMCQ